MSHLVLTLESLENPPKYWPTSDMDNSFYRDIWVGKFPDTQWKTFKGIKELCSYMKNIVKEMEDNSEDVAQRYMQIKNMDGNAPKDLLRTFDERNYERNNIDAIILPAGPDDMINMKRFISSIGGRFSERINDLIFNWESTHTQYQPHELYEGIGKIFYNSFKIPVFEVHKAIPGYRFYNNQIGREEFYKDKVPYVKCAYERWIYQNWEKEEKRVLAELP